MSVADHLVRVNAMARRVRAESGDTEPLKDHATRAEIPAKRTNIRIDDAEVVRLRAKEWTLPQIARHLGCSRSAVTRALRRTGVSGMARKAANGPQAAT